MPAKPDTRRREKPKTGKTAVKKATTAIKKAAEIKTGTPAKGTAAIQRKERDTDVVPAGAEARKPDTRKATKPVAAKTAAGTESLAELTRSVPRQKEDKATANVEKAATKPETGAATKALAAADKTPEDKLTEELDRRIDLAEMHTMVIRRADMDRVAKELVGVGEQPAYQLIMGVLGLVTFLSGLGAYVWFFLFTGSL